jgi:hypothetical protein
VRGGAERHDILKTGMKGRGLDHGVYGAGKPGRIPLQTPGHRARKSKKKQG